MGMILFRTNDEFYALWLGYISKVGFELSLGKNYVHDNYLMINSESFWYDGKFTHIPYLNVGLLTGQSKLTGRMALRLSPIWEFYNKTLAGASNKLRTHFRFLKLNRESIKQFTKDGTYNLFIDQLYGGLGFDLYPEIESCVHYTHFQRKFGAFLKSKVKYFSGDLSDYKKEIGIVSNSIGLEKLVSRYHFGHYELRPYKNQGSISAPQFVLLLDPEERLGRVSTLPKNLLVGDLLESKTRIIHPRPQILRRFREANSHESSIRSLLSQPREVVELERVVPQDVNIGSLAVIAQNGVNLR